MLIKIVEAGKRLQMHPATLRHLIKRGLVPAYRVGSRILRVDLEEVRKAMKGEAQSRGKRPA